MKRLLVLPLVLAACSSALTHQRLEPSFARTFSGLYAIQQDRQGRQGVQPDALHAAARCARSGPSRSGPGDDWLCVLSYRDGAMPFSQTFELQVKADGCWKAEAPPAVQPALLSHPVTGRTSANPLAEFEGCLDASWR